MSKLAFLDLETTGLDSVRCEPWEIGVILRDSDLDSTEPGAARDTEHLWRIYPNLRKAEPTGLRIGRFYERTANTRVRTIDTVFGHQVDQGHVCDLAPGVVNGCDGEQHWSSACQLSADLARMLDGRHIVGAVPSFDESFLKPMFRTHRESPTWHYHLIDIEAMMVGFLMHARATGTAAVGSYDFDYDYDFHTTQTADQLPWRSKDLSRAIGVDPANYEGHTALGDARWARDCYDAMAKAKIQVG